MLQNTSVTKCSRWIQDRKHGTFNTTVQKPYIARCAHQDTTWEVGPAPRTYNTNKTVTGAKVAEKIRDLRLRRNLTGKTSLPRLTKKTNPKQLEAEQVDFEEEVARYKRDIAADIQQLKQQEYKEPAWIRKIINQEANRASDMPRPNRSSSSSAHWEQPISDTQAVELSNYLLTAEEEQDFLIIPSGSLIQRSRRPTGSKDPSMP